MEELQNLTPLYNKEFYLAYLCGEDVELPIPDGNTEHYLAYLCGMDVPIPDPLYTKEFYLAYKCGMDVELPEPGPYRIDQYLAKWCGMDVEVPEPMYRIEYWLAQLANSGELKTVSGNPISVSDALAKPAESLVIEILPQQSGSGDPSPDNVRPISGFTGCNVQRTGKNLCTLGDKTFEQYQEYEVDEIPAGSYTYSGVITSTDTDANKSSIIMLDANKTTLVAKGMDRSVGGSRVSWSFTVSSPIKYIRLYASNGFPSGAGDVATFSDNMIELGSTATDYAPYNGTTYSIDWTDEAGTVYGGSLDVTSGVLTVTDQILDMASVIWVRDTNRPGVFYCSISSKESGSSPILACSCYKLNNVHVTTDEDLYISGANSYGKGAFVRDTSKSAMTGTEFKNSLSGQTLVYKLATPLVIQLTPTEVQMLLGDNVIWNDVGDMTLEYMADGPADDADALMILLGNRYVNNGEADEATDREALEILLGGNTR